MMLCRYEAPCDVSFYHKGPLGQGFAIYATDVDTAAVVSGTGRDRRNAHEMAIETFSIAGGSGCTLTDTGRCATSKNYPSSYGNSESCTLTAPVGSILSVEGFDTEGGYDELEVNGEAYSGVEGPIGVRMEDATIS